MVQNNYIFASPHKPQNGPLCYTKKFIYEKDVSKNTQNYHHRQSKEIMFEMQSHYTTRDTVNHHE